MKTTKIISLIFYVLTLLVIIISYTSGEFILCGFVFLLLAAINGLVTEFFKRKRLVLIVLHLIGILFSVYILYVFFSFDMVPTMIYYG